MLNKDVNCEFFFCFVSYRNYYQNYNLLVYNVKYKSALKEIKNNFSYPTIFSPLTIKFSSLFFIYPITKRSTNYLHYIYIFSQILKYYISYLYFSITSSNLSFLHIKTSLLHYFKFLFSSYKTYF